MISGDLLREARLRAGLTQRELARRAATSQSAVARWESGEVVPSFERLRELIRVCGLELTVGLAEYDDSYDAFIRQFLELTPGQRIERAVRDGDRLFRLSPSYVPGFDPVALVGGLADPGALATAHGDLDVILDPPGTSGYADLLRDAMTVAIGSLVVEVASLRDVIRMKEASYREKNRAQLPALRRTLELIRRREREG